MRIIEEEQLDFDDVLIQPKRSTINSRKEVNIYRDIKWKDPNGEEHVLNCIPIMSANMGTVGTLEMAKHLSKAGYLCALEKHYTYDDIAKLFLELQDEVRAEYKEGDMPFGEETRYTQRIFPTVGLDADLRIIRGLIDNFGLVGVTLDVANGYIARLVDEVKLLRDQFPKLFIVAGNVVTADITTDLILAGANCLKCGIGSGSACTTRLKAGVGRPQLSTIIECADAAHQLHAYVMSDGGCVNPCDISKAFCAGADFVMLGGMLAGCDEADGEKVLGADGKYYKKYYGMSSKYAQEKHFGKFNNYRASEGREKLIPATGPLQNTIDDINGSLRSTCSYIGSHELRHMAKHATFYKVHKQLNTAFANCKDF